MQTCRGLPRDISITTTRRLHPLSQANSGQAPLQVKLHCISMRMLLYFILPVHHRLTYKNSGMEVRCSETIKAASSGGVPVLGHSNPEFDSIVDNPLQTLWA